MLNGVDANVAMTRHIWVEDLRQEPHHGRAQGVPRTQLGKTIIIIIIITIFITKATILIITTVIFIMIVIIIIVIKKIKKENMEVCINSLKTF